MLVRYSIVELLMVFEVSAQREHTIVSEFKVNSRLKNTQRNFQWNPWNALNKDV